MTSVAGIGHFNMKENVEKIHSRFPGFITGEKNEIV